MPKSIIVGLADGGDELAPARAAIQQAGAITTASFDAANFAQYLVIRGLKSVTDISASIAGFVTAADDWNLQVEQSVNNLGNQLTALQGNLTTINHAPAGFG